MHRTKLFLLCHLIKFLRKVLNPTRGVAVAAVSQYESVVDSVVGWHNGLRNQGGSHDLRKKVTAEIFARVSTFYYIIGVV